MNLDPRAALRLALAPRSIAVIGASDNAHKIGGRPLAYLASSMSFKSAPGSVMTRPGSMDLTALNWFRCRMQPPASGIAWP
jgi:hypothetical protein